MIAPIILTMPNKNKNKSNSYSVFVNAMRPQVEAETGKKMTFDEISEYVGPKWKVSTVNYYFSCNATLQLAVIVLLIPPPSVTAEVDCFPCRQLIFIFDRGVILYHLKNL